MENGIKNKHKPFKQFFFFFQSLKMKIKAVLFDMFDTLMMIENNHQFYIPSLKKMYNVLKNNCLKEDFAIFINAYNKARLEIYKKADLNDEEPHFNERISKALHFLGYNYSKDNTIIKDATFAFCEEFMKYVRIDKHTKEVLMNLYKKYKIGLISNFAIPECVIKLLQDNDIKKFFSVIIVSGDVNKRKPNPEIFKLALNSLRLSASEVIFVGDSLDADIRGAQSVGITTVFIERRLQKEKEVIHPDMTIDGLKDLLLLV